jgi:hypothetical protein
MARIQATSGEPNTSTRVKFCTRVETTHVAESGVHPGAPVIVLNCVVGVTTALPLAAECAG